MVLQLCGPVQYDIFLVLQLCYGCADHLTLFVAHMCEFLTSIVKLLLSSFSDNVHNS